MATQTVKTTYALDVETVRRLEELARRWNVSKSEALRRAIRGASAASAPANSDALDALDSLQRELQLDARGAGRWASAARRERRDSSQRSESRGR